MSPDPKIIAAIQAAVDADPESAGLRLHLAGLLLDSGDAAQALPHFEQVLMKEPANLEALRGVARACEEVGQSERAAAYRKLAAAMSPAESPPAPSNGEDDYDDEDDERLYSGGVTPPEKVKKLRVTDSENEDFEEVWEVERPKITLADVGGLQQVKKRLTVSFLAPMKNPEIREAFGKSLRGGLLMFGPPGCGKTFIARALAGELEANFIAVGISDVLDMWLGNSEKNVHAIFELARKHAPTVLFFDEVDAIGRKRVQLTNQAGRNVVNQLLAEMDGIEANNDGIFILGATNHPWDVDAAMLRPGRFDRHTLVLPPDEAARSAILRHHLVGRPVEAVDVDAIAKRTPEFSGADLMLVCETAAEMAMEEALESGVMRPITERHMVAATKSLRPTTRQWFETARNFAIFANQSGIFDEVLQYMKTRKIL